MPRYELPDGRARWTYVVYVIELDKRACSDRRARCGGCEKTPVYVGHTARTTKERFQQHREGVHASYWPRNYGRWVQRRLGPREEFETKEDALRAEAAHACRLAERGFCVYGGH
jgi:hypothetical protein